jgi:hypothetical protein
MRLLPERHDHGGGALLKDKPKPTDADIDAAMTNICRCGTYQQVRAAIHAAAITRKGGSAMTYMPKVNRRKFLIGAPPPAADFSLGFSRSRSADAARAEAADRRSMPGW